MEDRIKELARQHMEKLAAGRPAPRKFSFELPGTQEDMAATLLGIYGAQVEGRDMEFVMDDATVGKVERVVKWMYESRKRGLLLCGTLGNGKTTMLKSIKSLLEIRAEYFDAQSVFNFVKQNKTFPDILKSSVLLIDDLGVEPPSFNDFGEVRYPLAELLTSRYNQNLPTVIATNLTFDQIGEVYGDRLKDRMREMFAIIIYREPSYRK